MRTPSLVTRVVVIGVAIVTLLVVGIDLLLYFSLRGSLNDGVEATLANDARAARGEAVTAPTPELPARLAAIGIHADVRTADGVVVPSPLTATPAGGDLALRAVRLPDGSTVTVAASRTNVDRPLSRLLRMELIISPLVIALAFMLLRLIAEVALRPLDQIAAAARRTAGGKRGERLRPDRPDTRLGLVASAYDEMVDALEAAVAEARQAQTTSERLQEHYRQILETAREAFIAFDHRGVIVEWNVEAERTFGWTREDAIGLPLAMTILPADAKEGPFADPEWFLAAVADRPLDRLFELTAIHRDGHTFPAGATVWVSSQDEGKTINAFLWDKTDRLKAQEAISRLAAIVETTDEAILSTDLSGRILTWNQGAEKVYGYTAEEAVGQDLSLITPSEWRQRVSDVLDRVEHGQPVQRVEVKRRRKDGRMIDVALTISAMRDASGRICGSASIGRDVTAKNKTEAELAGALDALELALNDAQASEQATRQFLDDAAHQLRAPITSLRASAETLLRGASPDESDRLLGAVVRETSRASRLMSGLLHMARLNHGRNFVAEPCDLVALCEEEVERAHWVAPQLDLAVTTEGTTPVGKPEVDSEAVSEIVANLLDNARRHAKTRIDVVVGRDNGEVELKVANDGPPIPADKTEAVFDRFVSLDGRGGSGLGLPIARELARAQGGDLRYENRMFVLRLPAHT